MSLLLPPPPLTPRQYSTSQNFLVRLRLLRFNILGYFADKCSPNYIDTAGCLGATLKSMILNINLSFNDIFRHLNNYGQKVEILQLQTKFQTLIVPCSKLIWMTNSRNQRCVMQLNCMSLAYERVTQLTRPKRLIDLQLKLSCGH